jgi:hypothetical protein
MSDIGYSTLREEFHMSRGGGIEVCVPFGYEKFAVVRFSSPGFSIYHGRGPARSVEVWSDNEMVPRDEILSLGESGIAADVYFRNVDRSVSCILSAKLERMPNGFGLGTSTLETLVATLKPFPRSEATVCFYASPHRILSLSRCRGEDFDSDAVLAAFRPLSSGLLLRVSYVGASGRILGLGATLRCDRWNIGAVPHGWGDLRKFAERMIRADERIAGPLAGEESDIEIEI